jgi:hypothetical protein
MEINIHVGSLVLLFNSRSREVKKPVLLKEIPEGRNIGLWSDSWLWVKAGIKGSLDFLITKYR